ncbi:MAG: T9SS type A sorting domain-containing protein [Flavobacteriales bacterium]|jgi:hypothetical protein|nr:MAG: T9SS type A sorting domain-containing protein [Flavobacteriales bacterium]
MNLHMKHAVLLPAALLVALGSNAQTPTTVSIAAGYADQTFYSLANGVQVTSPLTSWDLAFEINGLTSTILVNTAKGLKVYETPVSVEDWETLVAPDVANWTLISNSDTDWSEGALSHGNNLSEPDGLHLGWGEYDMDTHFVVGDKVYVVEVATDTYLKLRIDALIGGVYTFTYADLDGNNELSKELVKANFASKNYGYFNFTTGTTVDIEPVTSDWDLLFTKYTALVESEGEVIPYNSTGVLQNKLVGVVEVDGVDPVLASWAGEEFHAEINTIGYDWKSVDMVTFQWNIDQDRTYFVQDRASNIWKLVFTGFGGSSTGNFNFTQELVSATNVAEAADQALVVYPNPSTNGQLNIVLDQEVRNGTLTVLDRAGRLVKQQVVNGTGVLSTVPVDITGVEAGLYLVRLEAAGMVFTTRVVVE